ncbi:MAG: hypothetical protein H6822_19260 [Planctomycetaceae bacterium]|nr:hypothetical protein [Planctomycetales bacterium]MCB9924325.1 hypothetical protein [Planctomycetaceae bacterium]
MKTSLRNAFLVALASGLLGCGGGGSGGPQFPGVYSVFLELFDDPCGLTDDVVRSVLDEVNQNGRSIALRRGSVNYLGAVSDDNKGFTVVNTFHATNGCTVTTAVAYVKSEVDGVAFGVGDVSDVSCPGASFVCRVSYSGIANRT